MLIGFFVISQPCLYQLRSLQQHGLRNQSLGFVKAARRLENFRKKSKMRGDALA